MENFTLSAEQGSNAIETSNYRAFKPIELIFETVHPDDLEQHLTIVYCSPNSKRTYTLSYNDPINPVHRTHLHHHEYFELIYVLEGQMYQIIENKQHLYTKGSLCILNRNIYHAEQFHTEFRAAFLSLPVSLIEDLIFHTDQFYFKDELSDSFQELHDFFYHNLKENSKSYREYIDFIPNSSQNSEQSEMHHRFSQITKLLIDPVPGATFLLKALLLQILSALSDQELYDTIPINIGTEREAKLFDAISELIINNKGRIPRSAISAQLKYDGSYINNIVKKYTGLNLFQYSTVICMKEARRLLEETDLSISEIADQLSFTNRTHFYKLFKEQYSMTPKKYRTKLNASKLN